MSLVILKKAMGKPRRVASDPERAAVLLREMEQLAAEAEAMGRRRLEMARELHGLGVTMSTIGAAAGVTHMAVSKWLREDVAEKGAPTDE